MPSPSPAGPFVPDAFTDTKDGRGITWGLSHFTEMGTRETRHSILARFDCDLSQDVHDPNLKQTAFHIPVETYLSQALSRQQRKRIAAATKALPDEQ